MIMLNNENEEKIINGGMLIWCIIILLELKLG